MKILLAEDDLISRRILEAILGKWNYDVISVTNGNDAVDKLLEKNAPLLVLLDWVMPDKDGVEVCRIIREKETTSPPYIILLTSKREKKDVAKGLDSGADDYIIKPYDENELRARLNVGCRMIELQNALAEKEKFQGVLEMAGAVCHEINQPLMTITGYSEFLLQGISEDNPQFNALHEIYVQGHRLGNITKQLMEITTYKTKRYLQREIVDIDQASQKKPENQEPNSKE